MRHLQRRTRESCGNGLRASRLPSFREAAGGTERRREKGSGGLPSMLTPIFYVRVHHRPPFHILKKRLVAKGKQGASHTPIEPVECRRRRVNDEDGNLLSTTPPSSGTNQSAVGCWQIHAKDDQFNKQKKINN